MMNKELDYSWAKKILTQVAENISDAASNKRDLENALAYMAACEPAHYPLMVRACLDEFHRRNELLAQLVATAEEFNFVDITLRGRTLTREAINET